MIPNPSTSEKWEVQPIIEAVFYHGKHTPNEWHNLPEGQLTIADALDKINAFLFQERTEAEERGRAEGRKEAIDAMMKEAGREDYPSPTIQSSIDAARTLEEKEGGSKEEV